jgi:hypothetical protein
LKEYIKMYIYRKINLSINILIFIYIVNITWKEYLEYNFFFIIIIVIIMLYKLILIILKKQKGKTEMTHFLSLPFIPWIITVLLLLVKSPSFILVLTLILLKFNKPFILNGIIKKDEKLEAKLEAWKKEQNKQ